MEPANPLASKMQAKTMADLDSEIKAYQAMSGELGAKYPGKWVLVHDGRLEGAFDRFETTAEEAVRRFGRGPYLIRQVGAPPIALPASVMFGLRYAQC